MLFTLSRSPFQCDLSALLRLLQPGDDVLMLQDGVIAAIAGTRALTALQQSGARLYILIADVEARGLATQISSEIAILDYTGFVALTAKNPQQIAW